MPNSPFKPLRQRKADVSHNPKTILNRSYVSAKRGLDIALYRDQKAFQVAKSRALKKLHDQASWDQLNEEQREKAENAEIDVLIAKRDSKKQNHLQEWRRKVEAGEISDEEGEDEEDEAEEDDEAEEEDEADGEEWIDMDDDDDGETLSLTSETVDGVDFVTEILAMKRIAGVGWANKMTKLECIALKEAQEWEDINVEGNL
jgi:hypothetical protein